MREATIQRKTAETDINLSLNLDGCGKADIKTGCGFFDHMLTLLAVHGSFDLSVVCSGDTYVDYHHSVEDIGIALGKAFYTAIGDKSGINRYGDKTIPMDEALVLCAVDISGRDYLGFDAPIPTEKVGDMDTELVKEFFLAFTREARITLHIKELAGENSHHIIECIFKAFGRALSFASAINPLAQGKIPSSKGVL
ncbi:MAG: imidazoleglycerol-phosphate dehydratase HisB [Oscillospiraceae bacterium]|nr:imidazoleglycerol-phosphate dehydratase HisB [Oscillospiraceae bacterium]